MVICMSMLVKCLILMVSSVTCGIFGGNHCLGIPKRLWFVSGRLSQGPCLFNSEACKLITASYWDTGIGNHVLLWSVSRRSDNT